MGFEFMGICQRQKLSGAGISGGQESSLSHSGKKLFDSCVVWNVPVRFMQDLLSICDYLILHWVAFMVTQKLPA